MTYQTEARLLLAVQLDEIEDPTDSSRHASCSGD